MTRVLNNFISPLQRKEFNQDRFGSSCQYQTSVFQDNRVSPDVIPDSFTHLNKCQDFTVSINDSKQVNIKYTIRSIVCEALLPIIWSSGHLVIRSSGHPVNWSSCHQCRSAVLPSSCLFNITTNTQHGSWVFFIMAPVSLHITRKLYQIMSPRQEGEVYLSNGRVLPTPDGSDSSGFSEKAASSELSCSDYCSTGGE